MNYISQINKSQQKINQVRQKINGDFLYQDC